MSYIQTAWSKTIQDITSTVTLVNSAVDTAESHMVICSIYSSGFHTDRSTHSITVYVGGYKVNGQSVTRIKPAGETSVWYQLEPIFIPANTALRIDIQSDNDQDLSVNLYGTIFQTQQADVCYIFGDSQSAEDLKHFADEGYDPDTGKVQKVLLTDTCTTNTDLADIDTLTKMVALQQGYDALNDVIVAYAATDALRGDNLATAYTAAKALRPGGQDLSATNRARVFLPPWHYSVSSTLTFDTSYVDIIALYPEKGGDRSEDDIDLYDAATDLKYCKPPRTLIYSSTDNTTTVEQSATDVYVLGFGIAQLSGDATNSYHALYVSATSNVGSLYQQMYFWHRVPNNATPRFPVAFAKHVNGTWEDCIANSSAWRVYSGAGDTNSQFAATMIDCQCGPNSIGGDYPVAQYGSHTHKMTQSRIIRCKGVGIWQNSAGTSVYRGACFSGCDAWSIPIDDSCYFEDCYADEDSYCVGEKNEGTFVRCQGKENCFAGGPNRFYPAEFAGVAIECMAEAASFGGNGNSQCTSKTTGTLLRCVSTGHQVPMRFEGATIEDCLIDATASNVDCVTLLDSNSRIHNSTILVVEGGTGIPINAASALNVSAVGNRYNNVSAATNGLGSNVTNVGAGDAVATDTASRTASQADVSGILEDTGTTLPATLTTIQEQIGNISTGSDSVSTTATGVEDTLPAVVGTPTNTYAVTAQENGTYHSWAPATGELEFAYNFNIGPNASPTTMSWVGYCQGNNDVVTVYARNWVGGAWEQVGPTIVGTSGTTEQRHSFDLTTGHVNTGANSGDVRIRFVSTGVDIITEFATDRILCSYTIVNQSVGYADGAIWVDTNLSNTNTVDYVDGVADNPVSTWAAALTLSASLGIKKFHIAGGSAITLTADSSHYEIYGHAYTLALDGQTITDANISGARVTGTGVNAAGSAPVFEYCAMGAVALGPCRLYQCGIGMNAGTFVGASAGQFVLVDCFSMVAGSGTPYLVFTGTGSTTGVNNRGWKGGVNYTLDDDCVLSHEVLAGGGTTVTTGGASVEIRGITRAVTLTLSGAGTVQFNGVTGPITISGTATTAVNLYGISAGITDTSSGTTVTDSTVTNTSQISTVSGREITQGFPAMTTFATVGKTPVTVTVTGPNPNETITVSSLYQVASTNHWQFQFTPDDIGEYIISVADAYSSVVYTEVVTSVATPAARRAINAPLQTSEYATVWPAKVWDESGSQTSMSISASSSRALVSMYKYVVPYDGWIYGIEFISMTGLPSLSNLQFFTCWESSTDKVTVRGISEDFHGAVPVDLAWTAGSWDTYYFDRPVYAKRGDYFGFYGTNPTGGTLNFCQSRSMLGDAANLQEIKVTTGALSLTAENSLSTWGATVHNMPECKLLMQPPAAIIAGHSFWNGGCGTAPNRSGTVFEYSVDAGTAIAYNADYDPGAMLSDILGVPVCNCADGGTNISSWVGATGLYATNAAPLYPAIVIYDSAYNDQATATFGGDPTNYPAYLSHLLAHCSQSGSQLILMESPPSRYGEETVGNSETYELFSAVACQWAEHNGVPVIPLRHILGQHSGGDEHDSLRRWQKNNLSGVDDYFISTGDSYVHYTHAGLKAAMRAVAEGIMTRTIPVRFLGPKTTYDEVWPETTIANVGETDTVNIGKLGGSASSLTTFKNSVDAINHGLVVADVANSASAFLTNLAVENDNYYGDTEGGLVIAFINGATNQFQTRRVISSTTVTTYTLLTVEAALDSVPLENDVFIVLGRITEKEIS